MAKLKAPLLSLGASGQLGKAIVYFGWKGLDLAREYVIPANPKTTAQTTQRGYMTLAVAAIHTAQSAAVSPIVQVDKSAYALYGSTFPTPRTWFNQIIQRLIFARLYTEHYQIFTLDAFADPATTEITITIYNHNYADEPGFMCCGTSKTALLTRVAADGVGNIQTGVFTGLTKGVKYYFQFRPTKVTEDKWVARSGIYHHVCT